MEERRICTRCGERPVEKKNKTKFRAICWHCRKYKVRRAEPYVPATGTRRTEEESISLFWSKVNKIAGGCWEYTGTTKYGYGRFTHGGEEIAPRVAWLLTYGKRCEQNVLHHCDNRLCVNPDHLYEGTWEDNMRDMIERGRFHNGVRERVLSYKEVQMVRLMAKCGWSKAHIVRQFPKGIGTEIVSWCIDRRAWRDVPDYVGCE